MFREHSRPRLRFDSKFVELLWIRPPVNQGYEPARRQIALPHSSRLLEPPANRDPGTKPTFLPYSANSCFENIDYSKFQWEILSWNSRKCQSILVLGCEIPKSRIPRILFSSSVSDSVDRKRQAESSNPTPVKIVGSLAYHWTDRGRYSKWRQNTKWTKCWRYRKFTSVSVYEVIFS